MSETVCARCGAEKPGDGHCAACAFDAGEPAAVGHAHAEAPASELARWWSSGRLSVLLAGLCFLGALGLPLLGGLTMRVDGEFLTNVTVRPWDLLMGTYPALRGRLSAWLLPGAGIFLLSLLRSRRTAPTMMATRPLIASMSSRPSSPWCYPSCGCAIAAALPWWGRRSRWERWAWCSAGTRRRSSAGGCPSAS
jgi:hypothetical protein